MQNTHLAVELARRGRLRERNRTARVERGQAERGHGLGLLLAALVGGIESQPTANSPKSKLPEAALSRERSSSLAKSASVGPAREASENNPRILDGGREIQFINAPSGYAGSESPTEVPRERSNEATSVFDDGPTYRSDVAVQPTIDTSDFGRVAPGRVEDPSYEESGREFSFGDAVQTFNEPDTQVESTASHGAVRTEILADLQELVRAAEAHADEERERRELAKSRARLACYR